MNQGLDRAGALTVALASVFALVIGGAVGFITTFTHAQLAPWGLIAGLLIIAALVSGFRLVFGSRVIAAAAAAGVVAGILLLLLPGAGGPALVLDRPLSVVWVLAPVAVGVAAVLVRPRRMDS